MLSPNQWTQIIQSAGDGSGTPVTLTFGPAADTALKHIPQFEMAPVRDIFSQEFTDLAAEISKDVADAAAALEAFVKPGAKPPSKAELEVVLSQLRRAGTQMPSSMQHLQHSFKRVMEQAFTAARAELSAAYHGMAGRSRRRQRQAISDDHIPDDGTL
jgi:hypothetical protein